MFEQVLQWSGILIGWLCSGCFALVVVWYLLIWLDSLWSERQSRQQRKLFVGKKGEGFRIEDGKTVIVQEGLQSRLLSIGPFVTESDGVTREIHWKSPRDLPCDFATLTLVFVLNPDNVAPDKITFGLFEKFKSKCPHFVSDFKNRIVALHRLHQPDLPAEETLKLVEQFQIKCRQEGYGKDADHSLEAGFDFRFDIEHSYSLEYDAETGEFGDWEN